ncbi:OmpA family protein [Tabrizicola oligotrophica]|uniref:OmpA family protein n=1 Tax=Tabrizicola oligotrophica TaxID=2710650 RepID=UPI001D0F8D43|nr:OmpA family protein [Tabrizicola oligotrophica]
MIKAEPGFKSVWQPALLQENVTFPLVKLPALRLPFTPRLTPGLATAVAFAVAAFVALLFSWASVLLIERLSERAIRSKLLTEGITFAVVNGDGLRVQLLGTAPNEAARYRAINLAGSVVEASRVRDMMEVTPARAVEAPRFSLEMLRNDDGIQLIGLLPEGDTKDILMVEVEALQPDTELQDMLETAAYEPPATWAPALAFARMALALLPRSKITIDATSVRITAIAASDAEKRSFESALSQGQPEGVTVTYEISAPRPVITPFTLRFVMDAEGPRFDACAADSEKARLRIVAAATAAGAVGRQNCVIGLGVPSPSWAEAAEAGIKAVAELTAATITFKDADVTLQAAASVSQSEFDRVVGELEAALPDVFSLNATLDKAENAAQGPAEFTAVLAKDTGKVELRGRLADELQRTAVDSFAKAAFGSTKVYQATRLDPDLPEGWPVRVLAGLQALAELEHGSLLVRADTVEITGVTGSQAGRARIAQVLSDKLGQGKTYKVNVTYDVELDPVAALPTPQDCAEDVNAVLARQKITFPPGSAEIDAGAGAVMEALAKALARCGGVRMEIAGHTDAQGSEDGNRALSQARAEAVAVALQGRQVDVSGIIARGYGEERPIADNGTEAGREANRRIEFTLIGAGKKEAVAAKPATGDPAVQPAAAEGADFSADTSPSVAPKEKTRRPKHRPDASN